MKRLLKRALRTMHPGRYCDSHDCPCEEIRAALEQETCGDCGNGLEEVRPGKWQCNRCDLVRVLRDELERVVAERDEARELLREREGR